MSARATLLGLLAAVLALPTLSLPARAIDGPEDLPEGAGREEAFYACVACHSMQVVTRQGMTRGMWADTLTLMVERHGMFELEPDEHELILSYLAEYFPAVQAGGRGWVNPFD
ncbi:MAG: hypothetical protein ACXIU7_02700 [Roseinatronobacter sp.]